MYHRGCEHTKAYGRLAAVGARYRYTPRLSSFNASSSFEMSE